MFSDNEWFDTGSRDVASRPLCQLRRHTLVEYSGNYNRFLIRFYWFLYISVIIIYIIHKY